MRKKKEKLSIAMIGQKRIPSREGGIEVVVEELSTRMAEMGYDVICYNRSGNHVSGKQFNKEKLKNYKGVKIRNVLTIDKRGLAAVTSSFFAAINAAFGKVNIVHFHAEGPCAMIWIPKIFGKKCVATIHGLDHQREKWGNFASKYIKFGEKMAVKYADEIIVLSEDVKKYFLQEYERETCLIPNGVVKPQIKGINNIKKLYCLEGQDYFLYLGRIVPEKGIHYLIKAFLNVTTDKKLIIAGGVSDSSEYLKYLYKIVADDSRVIFTGFVQDELLEELYSNAYVYVLPSDLEGMPLSLLEAMSYGNCCLVSNISECTDVVEDNAIIFEKGNVDDLRKKMQYLNDNKNIVKTMKITASDFICNKYNWEDIVENTLNIYS
ncbi:glycosyltransferase family 4 protein [uncultured Clostridium sp.]|uniref:glycosyltransferase family 4 protein n=1 Tax=uncultured Clostridium sp. TaxID=59620 RepID=UPI00259159DF|nr:glycosyltransferase family 4 protein [uncultured Clostridium sp.]